MNSLLGAFDDDSDEAQRREAMTRIASAWQEALGAGVEADALAEAALFAALSDLVSTYGEDAVSEYAARLSERVAEGRYTVPRSLH